MNKGFVNSLQFYGSPEDSKANHKYHYLLEDYQELQKEHDTMKKRFQVGKQKRDILLDEVRFLRQRHDYLAKLQLTNVDINGAPIRKDMNHIVNKAEILKSNPLMEPVTEQEEKGRKKLVWMKPCIKKKPKDCLINDNKSGKRKISWQDKVVLEV